MTISHGRWDEGVASPHSPEEGELFDGIIPPRRDLRRVGWREEEFFDRIPGIPCILPFGQEEMFHRVCVRALGLRGLGAN